MVRLGIVGSNFGRAVLLPAFRTDPRCEVVALAGSDAARTQALARGSGIAKSFTGWEELVADSGIDAVAIATPPQMQPQIALGALENGKAVFAEKPLAADLDSASGVMRAAKSSGQPFAVDFEFPELPAWRRARELLEGNSIGALRHISVTWHVENYATRMRLANWRTNGAIGGGALGNFGSHCLHYMEHFGGPMRDMSAKIFSLSGEKAPESGVALTGQFVSGADYTLSMNAGAYLGTGHRLEFYGEDGTIILENKSADHARGFTLHHARRPAAALESVPAPEEGLEHPDSRIAPVARIAKRFLDAMETGKPVTPGILEAYRVQMLIDIARASHHASSESIMIQNFLSHRPGLFA